MNKISFTPFPNLTTERLSLRQLDDGDAAEIFLMRSTEESRKYIDREKAQSPADAQEFIDGINGGIANNEWIYWGITKKGNEKLIGTICPWNFSEKKDTAEMGYELSSSSQGKGFMQEAIKEVIGFAVGVLKLSTIEAHTNTLNTRSINLLEKNNFTRKKTITEKCRFREGEIKMAVYSLAKSNYLAPPLNC